MPLFIGAAVNAFAAQVYVNSASELNNAIINAVNGGTITITKDFAADANISAINNLKVSIGKDGTTDYFLSGNNSYGGFAIANSTVSINGINLSGFRKSDYGGALYAVSSTIKYTGNNIILSNNICSNAPIGSNVFGYVYGGAVYSESSANTFVSSGVIKFSNNSAAGSGSGHASGSGSGGAVYSVSSTNTFVSSGDLDFLNNSASGSASIGVASGFGGAIYSESSSNTFVSGGDINFSNNSALGNSYGGSTYGGAVYSGFSANVFNSSGNINFSNNILSGATVNYGGAIYSQSSTNTFVSSGDIDFSNNIASGTTVSHGGAVYSQSSSNTFVSLRDVNFSNNSAYGNDDSAGGAVYSESSIIAFVSSGVINFSNNIASGATTNYGGAIYSQSSTNTFVSSGDIDFSNNISSGTTKSQGGAIYSQSSKNAFNSSGDINFSNNLASGNSFGYDYGGAIYSESSANTFVSSGNINFSNNIVSGANVNYGGAIYSQSSSNTFASLRDVNFSNNSALGNGLGGSTYGGAIYSESSSDIFLSSGNITFSNNSAYGGSYGAGGAVYALNSVISFNAGALKFEGNKAVSMGGAFFIAGSTVNFNAANADMNILFKDNYANGQLNDIYLSSHFGNPGTLNFNATGGNIILSNGMRADGEGTETINKTGAGSLILGGQTVINNAVFNIMAGDIIFLDNASFSGPSMNLPGTALDMHNGTVNTVTVSGSFKSGNNLKMDVFSDGKNDRIKAGTAQLSGNIDIFAGLGTYNAQEFDLIITSAPGNLSGVFTSSAVITLGSGDLNYSLSYSSGIVKLTLNGKSVTNFGVLSRLTYNQSETAKAFGKISENPGNWAQILNEMATRQNNGSDADISAIKYFLSRTSGYFLANAVRNMAADSPNNEVYDKIRCRDAGMQGCGVTDNSGLWVQLKGGVESFNKDENSLEDYKDISCGVMFGFDRLLAEQLAGGNMMWGVYGRINKDTAEQGKNKADGNKTGLGLYGGYIKERWELKAMFLGSYDRFSTERMTYSGDTAKADITAMTASADLEAAIKILLNDNINFRPFAGVEAANTMYGGFKESGAGIYNLDAQSGNYLRTAARAGAGLNYEEGIWMLYANIEGKYLINGTKPEIESKFENTGAEFYSMGAKEGNLQIGAGVGGEVRISEHWKGFANAKYYTAERYENLYGNIGVRYLFGKKKNKEYDSRIKAAKAKAAEANAAADEALALSKEALSKTGEAKSVKQAYENKLKAAKEAIEQANEAIKKADEAMVKAREALKAAGRVNMTPEEENGATMEETNIDISAGDAMSKADAGKENAVKAKEKANMILTGSETEMAK